jgi:hypothetical protein
VAVAERKLRSVRAKADRERPPDLRDAVRSAVDAMPWLKESDAAIKALALRLADEIEAAVDRAEEFGALRRELIEDVSAYKRLQRLEAMCDQTKTVGWLGPQLQGVLKDLAGNPVARKAMKPDQPIGGRIDSLRARANVATAGEDDS